MSVVLNQEITKKLAASDPVMSKLIKKLGPISLQPRELPPYQSLIHAIIHQQLNGKVARVIFDRFVSIFNNGDFPTPDEIRTIDIQRMQKIGLSKSKANYIKEVAEMTSLGIVPSLEECKCLSDDEISDRLIKIKGVGPWTIEMLLIFNFGRLDVLPIHDLGVRRGFQIAYSREELPGPHELANMGEKWKPYRTIATLYLWREADFDKLDEW